MSIRRLILALAAVAFLAAACSDDSGSAGAEGVLVVGAIPDQDPDLLARNYDLLSDYLSEELGVEVQYSPVAEYDAAVTQFKTGDLDLVWFGGLTGVQARQQVEGSNAIAQRDIDAEFRSVFIARTDSGIEPFDDVAGLSVLAGRSFTFGSESSTSGRLMPQSFLMDAGVELSDLDGDPGFSGSHDSTIKLVEAGTYETGVLNEQVWNSRVESGEVNTDEVQVIFQTPPYVDYHWVSQSSLAERFGDDIDERILAAFEKLNPSDPEQAAILEFFSAGSFIPTQNSNYDSIETVAREVGLIE